MSFLPIVMRELRVASRRPMTYRLRSAAALIAGVITVVLALEGFQRPSLVGSHIFSTLSAIGLAYALFSGVRCTSDSLSEEKRAGTLGLLFLTDLRGYDIVLGKLFVTSLDAAYGLIAILPILAIPLLLGSVTGSEFWRMNLLLLNVLLFSLMWGLVVSTFGYKERGVMLITLMIMLGTTFGLPGIWNIVTWALNNRVEFRLPLLSPVLNWLASTQYVDLLLFPSPAHAFHVVTDGALRSASREYWWSMLTIACLSVIAFTIASIFLPRVFQERGRLGQSFQGENRQSILRFGHSRWRREFAESLLPYHPFFWLLSRDRVPRLWSWVLSVVLVLFAAFIPGMLRPRGRMEAIVVFGTFGVHFLLKFLIAADAARQINEDKRGGSLELLLSTPLAVPSILSSQQQNTRSVFTPPAVTVIFISLMIILAGGDLMHELGPNYIGGIVILFFDAYALTWLGILNGMRQTRYINAVLRTVGTVLGLPWIISFLFLFCARPNNSTVRSFFVGWFIACALFDLALAYWAKSSLLSEFRNWAANDYSRPAREEQFMAKPSAHRLILSKY